MKLHTAYFFIIALATIKYPLSPLIYSETSIYRSRIIRFPGSVVQCLWSLSESYFNYGSRIYCFPGSIVFFQTMNRGFTVFNRYI
jgi:hypothetical protein